MKIDRPELRKEFSAKKRCECCQKPIFESVDCAHVFSRGAGHVDIRVNLVGLRRACHASSHDGGRPYRDEMIKIVCAREGVKFEDVEAVVQFIRRLDQKASKGAITLRMELELSKSQKALATKELKEAGKL